VLSGIISYKIKRKREDPREQKLTTCVGSEDVGEIDSLGQVLGELDGISVLSAEISKGIIIPTSPNASSALSEICKFRDDVRDSNSGGR